MTTATIETTLRTFLRDNLMLSQIDFMQNSDDLALGSLAQTELRVFLEEQYQLDISLDAMPYETAQNLERLIAHVSHAAAATA